MWVWWGCIVLSQKNSSNRRVLWTCCSAVCTRDKFFSYLNVVEGRLTFPAPRQRKKNRDETVGILARLKPLNLSWVNITGLVCWGCNVCCARTGLVQAVLADLEPWGWGSEAALQLGSLPSHGVNGAPQGPSGFHCIVSPRACKLLQSCLPAAAQAVPPWPWEGFGVQFRGSVRREFELKGVDDWSDF